MSRRAKAAKVAQRQWVTEDCRTFSELTANPQANAYLGPMLEDGNNPLNSWITWQVLGVAIGALIGAISARRFKWTVDGPTRLTKTGRLVLALLGGMIAGLGARISLGCTSGLGLSGAATLATAGFLFLIGFFAAGALFGLLTRKLWS